MFVRFGKIIATLALAAMLSAHWSVLQTIAWTTMLADNLQTTSLQEAIVKTFDGKHPCPLCKTIAAGKKSEQKAEFTLTVQKLEFPPAGKSPTLIAPTRFRILPASNSFAPSLSEPPPTPPPREFVA